MKPNNFLKWENFIKSSGDIFKVIVVNHTWLSLQTLSAVSSTVSAIQIEISLFFYSNMGNFPPHFPANVYAAEKNKLIDRIKLF